MTYSGIYDWESLSKKDSEIPRFPKFPGHQGHANPLFFVYTKTEGSHRKILTVNGNKIDVQAYVVCDPPLSLLFIHLFIYLLFFIIFYYHLFLHSEEQWRHLVRFLISALEGDHCVCLHEVAARLRHSTDLLHCEVWKIGVMAVGTPTSGPAEALAALQESWRHHG